METLTEILQSAGGLRYRGLQNQEPESKLVWKLIPRQIWIFKLEMKLALSALGLRETLVSRIDCSWREHFFVKKANSDTILLMSTSTGERDGKTDACSRYRRVARVTILEWVLHFVQTLLVLFRKVRELRMTTRSKNLVQCSYGMIFDDQSCTIKSKMPILTDSTRLRNIFPGEFASHCLIWCISHGWARVHLIDVMRVVSPSGAKT